MDSEKLLLLGATGLLTFVAWLMVEPFLGYVLAAILLGFTLYPLHRKTRSYLGDGISSMFVLTLGLTLAVIPFLLASAAAISDAASLAEDINNNQVVNTTLIEQQLYDYTGRTVDIELLIDQTVDRFVSLVFGNISRIINLVGNMFIGFSLMGFLMYYILKDGERFVRWLKDTTPVAEEIQHDLYSQIHRSTWAVLKGHVLVAVLQGSIAGLGLWVAGVPNVIFWTFVMIMLGFIPIIGTFAIWGPAAIYLVVIGEMGAAIFLALYGSVMVGLVDNIVRPLAVDRSANIHPAVIIVGVLGGLHIFGAIGLFIGPVVLGALKSIIMVFTKYYNES